MAASGSDDPDIRLATDRPQQCREPAGQRQRIVVEEDQVLPPSRARAAIGRADEAKIVLVRQQPDTRIAGDHVGRRQRPPSIHAVVDDDDLQVDVVRNGLEQRAQAAPQEIGAVVGRDDDRDAGPRRFRSGAVGGDDPADVAGIVELQHRCRRDARGFGPQW
jgi:hypothetical protein